MTDGQKPDRPEQREGDALIARRKLLQSARYVAPAVLATLVVDMKRLAMHSCGPMECNPFGCKPVR